ncbi:GspH/FimT family pseudopilin [Rhodanobacter ginsengisoli]|uniref:Type II secretion system protein H n=1 Tax=Rhodanobacter ginsengisoli TaxID=418646 RepID=A0ABW0QNR1_9GAMM
MSLIEQIMVLAIVAILTGIAAPPLHRVLSHNRLQVAQTDFIAALQHARATAATSGRRTLFCPSVDGRHCSKGSRWDGGWLLGQDANGDHQPDHLPSYSGSAYNSGVRIISSAGRHDVRFGPEGGARGSNLTLLFCLPGANEPVLSVVVSNSGRIRGAVATATQTKTCLQQTD